VHVFQTPLSPACPKEFFRGLYFYPSRLAGEAAGPDEGGMNDIHFKPVDPILFRITLTARF